MPCGDGAETRLTDSHGEARTLEDCGPHPKLGSTNGGLSLALPGIVALPGALTSGLWNYERMCFQCVFVMEALGNQYN